MIDKPATTNYNINEFARFRWSPRSFDINKQVSHDQVMSLCEAARWSPSCVNDQPWRFIICDKYNDAAAYSDLLSCLDERNQLWAQTAPILISVIASDTFSRGGQENRWGQYDTGAAAMSICLEAKHQGLMAHQMGGFDANKIIEKLAVPQGFTPMSVIAVGYHADISVIDESFHKQEMSQRTRKDFNDTFFSSRFGKGII